MSPRRSAARPPKPSAIALAAKARRIAAGLTQQEVSERTGGALTKSAISMIESGTIADPGITKVMALAKVYGCSIRDLVVQTEEAEDLLDDADVDDPVRREQGLLLLQYWDELSEEQVPAALGIMKVLAEGS